MGNLGNSLKKFVSNKNTVTILVVIAGIIVLWYFYNNRVNSAISTVNIPYATVKMDSGKKIETENVSTKVLTKSTLKDNDIITDISQLENKYLCVGETVPKNGFFYQSQLCEEQQLQTSLVEKIPEGYTLYSLSVDSKSTYSNSILPGSYIDLYLSATDGDSILFGPIIKSIEVVSVRDSAGRDVFWDQTAGDSASLIFIVDNDFFRLLKLADDLITSDSIDIFPVIRNTEYEGDIIIGNDELEAFILRKLKDLESSENNRNNTNS